MFPQISKTMRMCHPHTDKLYHPWVNFEEIGRRTIKLQKKKKNGVKIAQLPYLKLSKMQLSFKVILPSPKDD